MNESNGRSKFAPPFTRLTVGAVGLKYKAVLNLGVFRVAPPRRSFTGKVLSEKIDYACTEFSEYRIWPLRVTHLDDRPSSQNRVHTPSEADRDVV